MSKAKTMACVHMVGVGVCSLAGAASLAQGDYAVLALMAFVVLTNGVGAALELDRLTEREVRP